MTTRALWLVFVLVVVALIALPKLGAAKDELQSVEFYCKEGYCAADQTRVEWLLKYTRTLEGLVIELRQRLKGQCT